MILWRLARWLGLARLAIAVLLIGGWCALAVWFRFAASEPVRDLLAGAILVLALVTVVYLATSRRWFALTAYAALFVVVLAWWGTITPSNDREAFSDGRPGGARRSPDRRGESPRAVASTLRVGRTTLWRALKAAA